MLRKKKGLVNMDEEKNYHLITVGVLSLIMTLGTYGIGLWLLVTDYILAGVILMVCATMMLYIALDAFGRIRRGRPGWGEYHVYD